MTTNSKTINLLQAEISVLQHEFTNAIKNNESFSKSKKIWKQLKALKEELKHLQ